jgi:hypothetical protein
MTELRNSRRGFTVKLIEAIDRRVSTVKRTAPQSDINEGHV